MLNSYFFVMKKEEANEARRELKEREIRK